jgi:uncharacterized protein
MWRRSFLILHGVENRRPAGHWQYDLAQRLRERGERVFYPQLPDPDRPALPAWIEAIGAVKLAVTTPRRSSAARWAAMSTC